MNNNNKYNKYELIIKIIAQSNKIKMIIKI